jgi:hypothetical protein
MDATVTGVDPTGVTAKQFARTCNGNMRVQDLAPPEPQDHSASKSRREGSLGAPLPPHWFPH